MSGPRSAQIARLLLAAMLVAGSACSSFDGRWRAAENPATAQGATRWDGRWTSEKHKKQGGVAEGGRLRCVLGEVATNCFPSGQSMKPGRALRADFRANWLLFTSDYTMTLTPVKGSRTEFVGSHDLPAIFGGTYRYTARIAGDRFTARYESSYDRGLFELSRIRP